MKIKRTKEFKPFDITIETQDEANLMRALFGSLSHKVAGLAGVKPSNLEGIAEQLNEVASVAVRFNITESN